MALRFVAVSESRVELGALFLKQTGISGFKRGAKICSLIEATHPHVVCASAVKSRNVSQDIDSHNNLGSWIEFAQPTDHFGVIHVLEQSIGQRADQDLR